MNRLCVYVHETERLRQIEGTFMAVRVVRNVVVHGHARVAFCENVDQFWKPNSPWRTLIMDSLKLRYKARARPTSAVGQAARVAWSHATVILPWLHTNAQK